MRNSETFGRSARIRQLLEYLVETVLAGKQDRLKESLIGFDFFERPPDYDPKIDPIVRVDMRRARVKLSKYYLNEGQGDPVLIWLEKGSYVPVMAGRRQDPVDTNAEATTATAEPEILPTPDILAPETVISPSAPLKTSRLGSLPLAAVAIAAIIFILIASGAFWYFSRNFSHPPRDLRSFPLTGNAGLETSPAFSPDGKQLAYSWDAGKRNLHIYVKPVEGGGPHRLTDNAAHDVHPTWSPDGQRIVFLRVYPEKSQLITIPATGGLETIVRETTPPVVRWHPGGPERAGTSGPVWSPDGSYIVLSGRSANAPAVRIVKVYLDGREEPMTNPEGVAFDANPSLSPSGKTLAYTRTLGTNSTDVFAMPSKGGDAVRFTSSSEGIEGLTWLDENRLIYSANRGGNFHLWQVARANEPPQPLPVSGTRPQLPAVSRDRHWLAFVEFTEDTNIWQIPLGVGTPGAAQPFISSAGSDNSPTYSPDGRKIAFISDRSGSRQIWLADSDGTEERQLTTLEATTLGTPRWSPDSRQIVFDASIKGRSAVWLTDSDGNNAHRLNNSKAREYVPSWSRDGKWVYYLSLHEGTDQLWKQRTDSGELVRVTSEAFFDATELPTGDFLYAQRPGGGIWQISLRDGQLSPVPELNGVHPARYWAIADDKLYFVRQERPPRELEVLDLKTRQIRKLTTIPGELLVGTPGLTVDPSLHNLLFVQKNQRRSSIILQER